MWMRKMVFAEVNFGVFQTPLDKQDRTENRLFLKEDLLKESLTILIVKLAI